MAFSWFAPTYSNIEINEGNKKKAKNDEGLRELFATALNKTQKIAFENSWDSPINSKDGSAIALKQKVENWYSNNFVLTEQYKNLTQDKTRGVRSRRLSGRGVSGRGVSGFGGKKRTLRKKTNKRKTKKSNRKYNNHCSKKCDQDSKLRTWI